MFPQQRVAFYANASLEADDAGTFVVVNLAFCSLGGHEFRRKGVGRAMVNMMIAWARENGWRRIEVHDVTGGLFPWDWLDACIPPRPFWERMGFTVFNQRLHAYTEEELDGLIVDSGQAVAASVQAGVQSVAANISTNISSNVHATASVTSDFVLSSSLARGGGFSCILVDDGGRSATVAENAKRPENIGISQHFQGVSIQPTLGVEPKTSALRKPCSAIELGRRVWGIV